MHPHVHTHVCTHVSTDTHHSHTCMHTCTHPCTNAHSCPCRHGEEIRKQDQLRSCFSPWQAKKNRNLSPKLRDLEIKIFNNSRLSWRNSKNNIHVPGLNPSGLCRGMRRVTPSTAGSRSVWPSGHAGTFPGRSGAVRTCCVTPRKRTTTARGGSEHAFHGSSCTVC